MENLLPGWDVHWRHVGWPFFVPFLLHALRATVALPLLLIPRNHPRRELLIVSLVLFAIATDLLDGTVARTLRMTGLKALSYGDLTGDLGFWIGAGVVVSLKLSLVKDLPPPERGQGRRRAARLLDALWIALIVALAAENYGLVMNRALTIRWR